MDHRSGSPDRFHRAWFTLGEWIHRELQRAAARRTPEWGDLLHPQRGPGSHRSLAAPLQCRTPTWQPGIPAAGTGNDHLAKLAARLRSAPPATQLGGETAHALTFKLDQSVGAGHRRSRHRRGGGGRTASRRQGRHQDDRGHAGECRKPSVGCRRPTFVGRAGGVCGRQRLPFARRSERPGRWPLDVPDRRAAACGIFPLARGRRGAQGGLQQSRPSAIGHRQRGHAQAGRDRRAVLRPHPGSGRHAANLAARS